MFRHQHTDTFKPKCMFGSTFAGAKIDLRCKIDSNMKLECGAFDSRTDFYTQIYCSSHFYINVSKDKSFYIQLTKIKFTTPVCYSFYSEKVTFFKPNYHF